MESLIKQTRSKFASKKEEKSSTTEGKTPPQKAQSFKEKKRSQGWLGRQFSRQMSWDHDFTGYEYPTAVAAAAYAIKSLEESESWDKKETAYGHDKSSSKMKSKVDDREEKRETLKSALKSSGETSRASFKDSESGSTSKRVPEKEPSIKKRISFADSDETSRKPETILPKPDRPPTRQPTTPPVETRRPVTKPGPGDSAADAWEKEQMASITERYEKLRTTIDDWEAKKKKKAKRKIERIEAELDKKRAKAVQKYHGEITRIEGIAGGARAQAEENRRNEEFKVKEKANKIRVTGKLPATCLCF